MQLSMHLKSLADRIIFFAYKLRCFAPFSGFILSKTRVLDRINFWPINKGISATCYPITLSGLGTFDRTKSAESRRNS